MKKTKQLFLIILFLAFMGPSLASANVVFQQPDSSGEYFMTNAGSFRQNLGTGLSGTVGEISYRIKATVNVPTNAFNSILNCYDSSAYYTSNGCDMFGNGTNGTYAVFYKQSPWLVPDMQQYSTIDELNIYQTMTDRFTYNPNTYTPYGQQKKIILQPNKFYTILVQNSGNNRDIYFKTSTTRVLGQTYRNGGQGYPAEINANDLFFILDDGIYIAPSCFDGIKNQDETGIDTGGVCTPAVILQTVCADGVMNGDETGIDTGGRCRTHIIGFTPENGAFITGPDVTFTMDVWTNPEDIGLLLGVNLTLHNKDQNVLLLSELSPSDIYLLDAFRVPSAGLYHYESTRAIGNGNYTIEARLERAYLGGWIINPFSDINQSIYKHFIVGEATFIGTVSQSGYDALNGTASGAVVPGTTIATVASNCNPFAGVFDVQKCGIYLFVPGGEYFNKTMADMKAGLLTRAPWGYFYRIYDIWNNPNKATFPAMDFPVYMGPGNTSNPGIEHITIDPGDMIAGAGDLLDGIRDPHSNKSIKDIFGPMVQLTFALAVVFTIVSDLTGSHKHDTGGDTGNTKKKLS